MKYFKNTLFILVLFSSSLLFSQKDKVNSPDLLVVKFHADWCGSCIAMGPTFEDVQTKFDNENISFVKLDFTDSITTSQANKTGDSLGIQPILLENNRKTGFVLIIDNESKKVLYKLTKNDNVDVMESKIREFIEG